MLGERSQAARDHAVSGSILIKYPEKPGPQTQGGLVVASDGGRRNRDQQYPGMRDRTGAMNMF